MLYDKKKTLPSRRLGKRHIKVITNELNQTTRRVYTMVETRELQQRQISDSLNTSSAATRAYSTNNTSNTNVMAIELTQTDVMSLNEFQSVDNFYSE